MPTDTYRVRSAHRDDQISAVAVPEAQRVALCVE
jgi:hypothetical protein